MVTNVRPDADDPGLGGSAEPVAPPPQESDPVRIGQRRWAEDLHERIQREREPEPWPDWKAEAYHGELIVRELLDERAEILEVLARGPQDDNDASRHVRDAGWQVVKELREVGSCSLGALDALDHALGAYDSPARAPQGDPGPWRVVQNAGAQPQPRFVEYWEGPLPEQYGAQWVPNGFPTAEEAQAVCDALNAIYRKDRI